MKIPFAWFALAGALLLVAPEPPAVASGPAPTQHYLVISSHTKDGCLSALDDMALDPALLSRFDWGCKVGHHKGYAILEAPDEKAAVALLPPSQRPGAQAILMTKYTPEKLQEIHQRTGK